MAAPSVAWVDFDLDELLPHGPLSAATMTKIRNNQEHLKEISYDSLSYAGGSAHTHDGTLSSSVGVPMHENLLHFANIGSNGQPGAWQTVWSYSTGWNTGYVGDFSVNALYGGRFANTYFYQILGGNGGGESVGMIADGTGDGLDCVVSFFIRPLVDTLISGTLDFGFSDGNTTLTSSETLSYTDLSTGWRRVYARFPAAGSGHSTDVRFIIKVTATWTDVTNSRYGIALAGFQVNRGTTLAPWTISNTEGVDGMDGNMHWGRLPRCGIFDHQGTLAEPLDMTS